HKTPRVSGAAIRMEVQISVFTHQDGERCYRCRSRLFGENALTFVEAGVIAPLVCTIDSLHAMQAINVLSGYCTSPNGKHGTYD
ncbi:ThiF family adenylyltransferase, partial [Klebsiella pneumoniae]|uniref:ThiF family adenylyltransferase n=1 Tax=Klebsiella pneumoniae TaxID=573 RepID=UPI003A4C6BB3|nr:molybdopterin-synthase adenylyltransferase MoeB [Klebsiella pneumoniae]